jgi:hypothetical protein
VNIGETEYSMNTLYNDLQKLAVDAKDWTCSLLFYEGESPLASDLPVDSGLQEEVVVVEPVDLCQFLAPPNRKQGYPHRTNYMFPERFKGIESRMPLQVELKMAAINCGHHLIVRTSGG